MGKPYYAPSHRKSWTRFTKTCNATDEISLLGPEVETVRKERSLLNFSLNGANQRLVQLEYFLQERNAEASEIVKCRFPPDRSAKSRTLLPAVFDRQHRSDSGSTPRKQRNEELRDSSSLEMDELSFRVVRKSKGRKGSKQQHMDGTEETLAPLLTNELRQERKTTTADESLETSDSFRAGRLTAELMKANADESIVTCVGSGVEMVDVTKKILLSKFFAHNARRRQVRLEYILPENNTTKTEMVKCRLPASALQRKMLEKSPILFYDAGFARQRRSDRSSSTQRKQGNHHEPRDQTPLVTDAFCLSNFEASANSETESQPPGSAISMITFPRFRQSNGRNVCNKQGDMAAPSQPLLISNELNTDIEDHKSFDAPDSFHGKSHEVSPKLPSLIPEEYRQDTNVEDDCSIGTSDSSIDDSSIGAASKLRQLLPAEFLRNKTFEDDNTLDTSDSSLGNILDAPFHRDSTFEDDDSLFSFDSSVGKSGGTASKLQSSLSDELPRDSNLDEDCESMDTSNFSGKLPEEVIKVEPNKTYIGLEVETVDVRKQRSMPILTSDKNRGKVQLEYILQENNLEKSEIIQCTLPPSVLRQKMLEKTRILIPPVFARQHRGTPTKKSEGERHNEVIDASCLSDLEVWATDTKIDQRARACSMLPFWLFRRDRRTQRRKRCHKQDEDGAATTVPPLPQPNELLQDNIVDDDNSLDTSDSSVGSDDESYVNHFHQFLNDPCFCLYAEPGLLTWLRKEDNDDNDHNEDDNDVNTEERALVDPTEMKLESRVHETTGDPTPLETNIISFQSAATLTASVSHTPASVQGRKQMGTPPPCLRLLDSNYDDHDQTHTTNNKESDAFSKRTKAPISNETCKIFNYDAPVPIASPRVVAPDLNTTYPRGILLRHSTVGASESSNKETTDQNILRTPQIQKISINRSWSGDDSSIESENANDPFSWMDRVLLVGETKVKQIPGDNVERNNDGDGYIEKREEDEPNTRGNVGADFRNECIDVQVEKKVKKKQVRFNLKVEIY